MPIGDSKGAFYEDEFRAIAAPWFIDPKMEGDEKSVVNPQKMQTDKQVDAAEVEPSTGMGLEVSYDDDIDWSKLNQELGSIKSTSKEDTPVVARTPSGITITEGDIGEAIDVGVGAGPLQFKGVGPFQGFSRRWAHNDNIKPLNEHQQFIKDYDELHAFGQKMLEKGNYSEIAVQKFNKMGREMSKKLGTEWEDTKYVPPIRYQEKVGKAAIQYGDEVFEGTNHTEVMDKIAKKHKDIDYDKMQDGFTTSQGRFVSREEAMELARAAEQLADNKLSKNITGLLTEDLKK